MVGTHRILNIAALSAKEQGLAKVRIRVCFGVCGDGVAGLVDVLLFVCLSIRLSIRLSFCLSVCLSVRLLSVCLCGLAVLLRKSFADHCPATSGRRLHRGRTWCHRGATWVDELVPRAHGGVGRRTAQRALGALHLKHGNFLR